MRYPRLPSFARFVLAIPTLLISASSWADAKLPKSSSPLIIATPGYDLAVVGGGPRIVQGSSSGSSVTFTVLIKNLGVKPIERENVGCKLGSIEFRNVGNALGLTQGEAGRVVVTSKSAWSDIPTGLQAIECGATIAAPSSVREADTVNNTWSGRVIARPTLATNPDLKPNTASLLSCAASDAPTTATESCVDLEYTNAGVALTVVPFFVDCALVRISPSAFTYPAARATGLLSMATGASTTARMKVGYVKYGQYRVTCNVDPTDSIAEADEFNNALDTTATIPEPNFDLGIVAVDSTIQRSSDPKRPAKFDVIVVNEGAQSVGGAMVNCRLMYGKFMDFNGFSGGAIPSHSRATVTVTSPEFPTHLGADRPVECSVSITSPSGVVDQAPPNDKWSGTISEK